MNENKHNEMLYLGPLAATEKNHQSSSRSSGIEPNKSNWSTGFPRDNDHSQNSQPLSLNLCMEETELISSKAISNQRTLEIISGVDFYKGLVLFIPQLQRVYATYRNSPAMIILESSFAFSFGMPMQFKTNQKPNDPNMTDASVMFQDKLIAKASGTYPHARVEACVKSLELLSKTCYTIQASQDYESKCKWVYFSELNSLDLDKWNIVRQKYPNLHEVTKDSKIQKVFSVFLYNHMSSGSFKDIICCDFTNKSLKEIEGVLAYFHLTMLPWYVDAEPSKTHRTHLILKYKSAKELLEKLIRDGEANADFKVYPPNTYKDFYKLHQNYWDINLHGSEKSLKILEFKTTLEEEDLKSLISSTSENISEESIGQHNSIIEETKLYVKSEIKKDTSDIMKEISSIVEEHSSTVKAPAERMQILFKNIELLQEYESQVFKSGQPDLIKIFHNTCDIFKKDLDSCWHEIEAAVSRSKLVLQNMQLSSVSISPLSQGITSKSQGQQRRNKFLCESSASPRGRQRSRSPLSDKCV